MNEVQLFQWKETDLAREFTITNEYKSPFWIPKSAIPYIRKFPRHLGEQCQECMVRIDDWKYKQLKTQGKL